MPVAIFVGLVSALRKHVTRKEQHENENEDGMEMSVCTIHEVPDGLEDLFGKPRLEFAGARNALVYIQNGEINQIRGDKVPV